MLERERLREGALKGGGKVSKSSWEQKHLGGVTRSMNRRVHWDSTKTKKKKKTRNSAAFHSA